MAAYEILYDENQSGGLVDPFMGVDYDPESQTGTDWYNLMLSASLGAKPVHGATLAATCETLTKVTEDFARGHAIGRIHANTTPKICRHAGPEWPLMNLRGKAYHGTRTANKARMLFDTAEWEPSMKTRAKNAAYVGAILATSGANLEDARMVASACAGEEIPVEAITLAEMPLQVIKREAAAAAKQNHTVYSYANTQKAITWADGQLHADVLPADAAVDWARNTTIARYIAEGNMLLDPQFVQYATLIGVPYALVNHSWATTNLGSYTIRPESFAKVKQTIATKLPTKDLLSAYSGHAESMYGAIHRMANELAFGQRDPTIEALLKIVEHTRPQVGRTRLATGTTILAEPTRHRYSAEAAASVTKDAARSWDALTKAFSELAGSNRDLTRAMAEMVVAWRERADYKMHAEPLLVELCKAAVWVRGLALLQELLGVVDKAYERMARLKRSMLGNSAPLHTSCVLSAKIRLLATPHLVSLVRRIVAGDIPKLQLALDPRYIYSSPGILLQRRYVAAVNKHLMESRREWSERYTKLARAYGIASGKDNVTKSILFGCAAKAFQMLTPAALAAEPDHFVLVGQVEGSYLISIARAYTAKRKIGMPDVMRICKEDAPNQARLLDKKITTKVKFVDVEDFCYKKMREFFGDLLNGTAPKFTEAPAPTPTPEVVPDSLGDDEAALLAEFEMISLAERPKATYEDVLASYDTLGVADQHATANGYESFADAYLALGDKSRYDPELEYTQKGQNAIAKAEARDTEATSGPVI